MRTSGFPTSRPAIALATLVIAVLTVCPQLVAAFPQKDQTEFARLEQKAVAEGTVPVIVHLKVPEIDTLTSASTSKSAVGMGRAMSEQRDGADAALKNAITSVAADVLASLPEAAFTVNHAYISIPFIALRVTSGALAVLQTADDVIGIEEDMPIRLWEPGTPTTESATTAADSPQLDVSTSLIGATTAWSMGYTGAGWYVAIVDTGIRPTHQFFAGKTIVEACFAKGRDGLSGTGDCPNGTSTQTGSGAAALHPSTYEGYDHGVHVAGIAAGNNGSLYGVAKDANIIAVQVFSMFTAADCSATTPCVSSWASDTLAGLEYIYSLRGTYNIAAVNMSLGGDTRYASACDSDSRTTAISNLRSAGIASIVASGNSSWCTGIAAPACVSTAVSVGATNDSDNMMTWSNWSSSLLKLFAPGYKIYSSTGGSDTSYESWSGTSMATPHVTGAFAIMKQYVGNGSVASILSALQTSGISITSSCDSRQTALPRIRVDKALGVLTSYTLTLKTSSFGTTDPAPGAHTYAGSTTVSVTATPETYATFTGWSGDASGTTNPVTVTMDNNKSVTASFQYVYAPSVTGQKITNRSFSQVEYIHAIRWTANAANSALTISYYRVYQVDGSTLTKLADIDADTSEYLRRQAGSSAATYQVVAVTSTGFEGAPATITIQ
jgi:uncharacterized repeat protein (TIGR02543 family)